MALYDGFFDAVLDEESGEYDRAYSSGDFTAYFAQLIGSGVCIHNNPDSFLAEFEEDGRLFLRKGYLFIQGYWAANAPKPGEDPETYKGYEVVLPGNETYAIVAHLNFGQKRINIEVRSVSMEYPDALVLAIVNGAAQSAEDTRHNKDLCGIIDTAGELSSKVDWAVNYINTEIEDKLDQIEAEIAAKQEELDREIAAQEAELDAKINDAQQRIDSIIPDPIGTIKFSAAETMGENWLKCNGDFISAEDYPELVEMIGKLEPDLDGFQIVSSGEIGAQISNGVVYNGMMWVYSYSEQKLYGADLNGTEAVKEILVKFDLIEKYSFYAPSDEFPIALSIVPHKTKTGAMLFLAQGQTGVVESGESSYEYLWMKALSLVSSSFTGTESEITLAPPFKTLVGSFEGLGYVYNYKYSFKHCVPYVISKVESDIEYYYVFGKCYKHDEDTPGLIKISSRNKLNGADGESCRMNGVNGQRTALNKKNKDEAVCITKEGSKHINSLVSGIFTGDASVGNLALREKPLPLNIVGRTRIAVGFTESSIPFVRTDLGSSTTVEHGLALPLSARVFVDAGAYLWGRGIYLIFVGTGIIFSKTLESGSFGYLDTTSVFGTISNFGYLDYSEDEKTLYLMGQDSNNKVKVAKLKISSLFEYPADGALLPNLKMEKVPGWIKAKEAAT